MSPKKPAPSLSYNDCYPDAVHRASKGLGWPTGLLANVDHFQPFQRDGVYEEYHVISNLGEPAHLEFHCDDGRPFSGFLKKDEFLFTPGGHSVRWHLTTPARALSIRLTPEFIKHVAESDLLNVERLELLSKVGVYNKQVTLCSKALLDELYNRGFHGPVYAEALATALAEVLLRTFSATGQSQSARTAQPARKLIYELRNRIHDKPSEHISLTDLAAENRYSVSRIGHVFKEVFGISLCKYQIRQKIELSKVLLLRDGRSIEEIAKEVGFGSLQHFYRHFVRIVGMTPGKYRATAR
jgi:AraC-like DNA-binding protein